MRLRNPKSGVDAYIGQQPRDARNREVKARRLEDRHTDHVGDDCLKVPCLQCGRRASLKRIERGAADSKYYVRCKACGPISRNFASRDEAVKAWNGEGAA